MTRTMFDGINSDVPAIPTNAQLVAGYVDGLYKWSPADWARFPNAAKVRIAVFATTNDGEVLDCEPGNCTPAQSVDWVLMRRAAGVDPTVYCNELNPVTGWPAVRAAFHARGVPEPHYWVANYSANQTSPQIPEGAVALQYTDAGNYDLSVVADYWPGVDPAPNASPLEVPMQDGIYAVANDPAGNSPGIWAYIDGRYGHVPTVTARDALVALLGVQQKPLAYEVHQWLLALTAPAPLTVTDAQAQIIGAAIGGGIKFPTKLTLTGTETGTLG